MHHEPEEIDQQFIRLAFRLARALNTQSVAIDGMYRGDAHVIGEISFTYASYAVYDCPGHWVLDGDPEVGELRWVDGQMWPQIAIIEDFVEMLLRRRES